MRGQAKALVGKRARVTVKGDPMYGGRTLRWGVVTAVTDQGMEFERFADCNDIEDGTGMRGGPSRRASWDHILEVTDASHMALV